MKAVHHNHRAINVRNRQRRRFLYANAPYLALIPLGVVTVYPPAQQYATEVYFVAGVVFGVASARLALRLRKKTA